MSLPASLVWARPFSAHWRCAATGLYTSAALPLAGVPVPKNLITAEKVTHGKPHPEPYTLGASILSVEPQDCE